MPSSFPEYIFRQILDPNPNPNKHLQPLYEQAAKVSSDKVQREVGTPDARDLEGMRVQVASLKAKMYRLADEETSWEV